MVVESVCCLESKLFSMMPWPVTGVKIIFALMYRAFQIWYFKNHRLISWCQAVLHTGDAF